MSTFLNSRQDDVPVVAVTAPSAPARFLVPPPPAPKPGAWVPPGTSVDIAGIRISGGLIYVGLELSAPNGAPDPCLIDPSLPISDHGNFIERQTAYWPSYVLLTPVARKTYLQWLASDRAAPDADMGYVFLYLYGLERRVIFDGTRNPLAQADWPLVAQELARLIAVYGKRSTMFKGCAQELLQLTLLAQSPKNLYSRPIPTLTKSWELPFYIQLALGQAARDQAPLPSALALAWLRYHPSITLRTSALRCPELFERVFTDCYHQELGDGMVLACPSNRLKLNYRPASAAFRGPNDLQFTFDDAPNVTIWDTPVTRLKAIADLASESLDAYSRYVGKTPHHAEHLESLLLLPPKLWVPELQRKLETLAPSVAGPITVLPWQELTSQLGAAAVLSRDVSISLSKMMRALGWAVEPAFDEGERVSDASAPAALVRIPLPTEPATDGPCPHYVTAKLTVKAILALLGLEGSTHPESVGYLQEQIRSWTHLSEEHRARLLAVSVLPPPDWASNRQLKSHLQGEHTSVGESVGALATTALLAQGPLTPATLGLLKKFYKAVGLPDSKLLGQVHARAAVGRAAQHWAPAPTKPEFTLDVARLAQLERETQESAHLLASIFSETAPEPIVEVPTPTTVDEPSQKLPSTPLLPGLDARHDAFARKLLTQPTWALTELQALAQGLGLMLDGALERINDAAFDTFDLPFTDGEPLEVTPEILELIKP